MDNVTCMDNVAAARANSIGKAMHRAADLWGPKTALQFSDRKWSFTELHAGACSVAAHLYDIGLQKGDRVAAFGKNSDAYFLLWLGCAEAGMIHVPISYALTGDALAYHVNQCGARALFSDPCLADQLESARNKIQAEYFLPLHDDERAIVEIGRRGTSAPYQYPVVTEADIAQIMYTSGTTSAPKGAMMSHGAMLAQYHSCIQGLDYSSEDRCLAALPLYHTAQTQAFSTPQMLAGAYTHLIQAPLAEQIFDIIEAEKITSFFAPPTVWINLLRHPDFDRHDLSSLRKVYYGASIMPTPILEELRKRLPNTGPYNVYGQTEIAPVATVLRPEEHGARPSSAGRPVINVQTRIVDENMGEVLHGAHGEIVHRSPQLLSGYWDKPEETETAFAGGWFHSGDIGYQDEEGYIYIVDRLRDVINTGGVLVSSREVEEALYTHPAVAEVAVIALPHPKWIEAIVAVVVLREGASVEAEALQAHVREKLPPLKTPKRIVFAANLPKNASGKVLKRELRETIDCE